MYVQSESGGTLMEALLIRTERRVQARGPGNPCLALSLVDQGVKSLADPEEACQSIARLSMDSGAVLVV